MITVLIAYYDQYYDYYLYCRYYSLYCQGRWVLGFEGSGRQV